MLLREDETPFYVGFGRNNRWLMHEKLAKPGRSRKDNIICRIKKSGLEVKKIKVQEGLSRHEAIVLEIKLIARYGRCPNGCLTNLTDGGEGRVSSTPSKETRQKMSNAQTGRRHTGEAKKKISKNRRGIPMPEYQKIAMRGRKFSIETREKLSLSHQGKRLSEKTRQKLREAAIRQWKKNNYDVTEGNA